MQNNIYITNFWYARNYGANLTAYALFKLVSNFSGEVYLLDNLDKQDKLLIETCYMKDFIQKYFKIKKFDNEDDQAILITGSDQVFSPKCEPNKNDTKYLNFGNMTNKRISVSASFGVDKETFLKQNSQKEIEKLNSALKTFDFVSVREKSGIEICKDIFNTDAEWIIDPVFMLEKEKWEELINKASENIKQQLKDNKIVSYIFLSNETHQKAKQHLAEKYKTGITNIRFNDNNSPEDWLYAIKNCELFITNSFHGVCFAIIFNKPFICLSKEMGKSVRFESLFEMLEIENKSTTAENIEKDDCIFRINYENTNQLIENERKKGLDFLKKAIETPVEVTEKKCLGKISLLENQIKELEEQNNLPYQLKKYIWAKWIFIYNKFLPKPIKSIISFFWKIIKRNR